MNNQQPQFTIAELGAKFGIQHAQMLFDIISLEKVIESKNTQIDEMTKNEARLTGHIQELENEITFLRSENAEIETELVEATIANKKAAPE